MDKSYSFASDYGAVAFINIENIDPESQKAIKMKSGTLTDVIISKTVYQKAFTPKSECKDLEVFQFNRDFYNVIIKANYSYTQTQCFDVCLQYKIIFDCDCSSLEYLAYDKIYAPCLNKTQIQCANKINADFIDSDIKKNCELYCPLECNSILLEFSATTSNFPSKEYGELLKNFDIMKKNLGSSSINFDEITKNSLALNIYFNDLEYTQIEETEKNDIVDLVANVSGSVGVFIGISVLSFAELLEFFIEICFIMFKKRSLISQNTNHN